MKKFISLSLISLSLMFYSCEKILLEQDISISNVEMLAPGQGVTVQTSTISFRWTAVEGASTYHFQIATPGFLAPQQIITDSTTEDNFYLEELPEGDYEWRVKAINSGYSTSFSSASFRVEINEEFSDQRVNLFSPSDNYLSNENNMTLDWGEIEQASVYRVQIIQNGQVVTETTITGTNLTIGFPEGPTTWRVRAENDSQNTAYSERSIFVDTVEPETPRLISPADEADISVPEVTFEWERNNIQGSEEIDSIFVFKDLELSELVVKERVTTSYNKTLDRDETFYWFIRSYDAAGNWGGRSEVYSFTIN
ncbi:hypothetical protein LB467_16740 [Salegentibacter sp. JZCK2]|uniref:hypothetical protein n=1 Tax=Salegentibacter tibetensis TaxID=2873600 RepID=UPI001CCEDC21|nr:hypothetical protein [Salegentibacter tibetensis]MBZ9731338.1 hypothetical protein [Salegentibacter tibetensis]